MKKLLWLLAVLLLIGPFARAQTWSQNKSPIQLGFMPANVVKGSALLALSTALTWLQFGFIPGTSHTMSALQAYVTAVTASNPIAGDYRLEIVKDLYGSATASVVPNSGTSFITTTLSPMPFLNGNVVRFTTAIDGIAADTDYYVCNQTLLTFQIDATADCVTPLTITANTAVYVRDILTAGTASSAPAGASLISWTGLSLAVVGGTQYRAIIKNMNGSPTTVYPTFQFPDSLAWTNIITMTSNVSSVAGWFEVSTTTGTTWAGNVATAGIRLTYSDGTYEGIPFEVTTVDTTNYVYGAHVAGSKFTLPVNTSFNIIGACIDVGGVHGTPTGLAELVLWNGSSSYTGVHTLNLGGNLPAGAFCAYFSSKIAVAGGTTLRVVLKDSAADSSSNAYRVGTYQLDPSSTSSFALPTDGTMVETYTTNDAGGPPPTWTDTTTNIFVPVVLLLDTSGEFPAVVAGAGGTGRVVNQ